MGGGGFNQGKCLTEARFDAPYSIRTDPHNPNCYYVGDLSSIRYCTPEMVSLVAGDEQAGQCDGIGSDARFELVNGIVCASARGSDRLFIADQNHSIRVVDTKTRSVTTIVGDHTRQTRAGVGRNCSISAPERLTFGRSPTLKPESVLYITAEEVIVRVDIETAQLTICQWKDETICNKLYPNGIDCLPTGQLIVSSDEKCSLYIFDPATGDHQLLAGDGQHSDVGTLRVDGPAKTARFYRPSDLVVVDSERCLYVIDRGHNLLRHVTLPASFFLQN